SLPLPLPLSLSPSLPLPLPLPLPLLIRPFFIHLSIPTRPHPHNHPFSSSSFLIPHSSFLIPHSSFLIPHFSSLIIRWKTRGVATIPIAPAVARAMGPIAILPTLLRPLSTHSTIHSSIHPPHIPRTVAPIPNSSILRIRRQALPGDLPSHPQRPANSTAWPSMRSSTAISLSIPTTRRTRHPTRERVHPKIFPSLTHQRRPPLLVVLICTITRRGKFV
ncbi:hypothetical protein BC939DRAFT_12919, partial [Gamsiella multidivaricata]|uniref:uncharacterized protein n=1 Tax=Gamsiella multidivaricata TaxID=101098 RepID=UPI00221EBEA5